MLLHFAGGNHPANELASSFLVEGNKKALKF